MIKAISIITLYMIGILKLVHVATSDMSIDRVNDCYHQRSNAKNWKKKKDDTFHMHYGDPAVELFNIFSDDDVKRLQLLSVCITEEDSSYFKVNQYQLDQEIDLYSHPEYIHGRGNITYLNGIFEKVFPQLKSRIVSYLSDVFKSVDNFGQFDTNMIGIRSVKMVSFKSEHKMRSLAEMEKMRLDKEVLSSEIFSLLEIKII